MGVQITLTVAALERLFADETMIDGEPLTLALRRGVVEQFAKQHVKPILNDETYRRFHQKLLAECQLSIDEQLRALWATEETPGASHLPALLQRRFEQQFMPTIKDMVSAAIGAVFEEWLQKNRDEILKRAGRQFAAQLDAAVLRKIDEVASEHIARYVPAIEKALEPLHGLMAGVGLPDGKETLAIMCALARERWAREENGAHVAHGCPPNVLGAPANYANVEAEQV